MKTCGAWISLIISVNAFAFDVVPEFQSVVDSRTMAQIRGEITSEYSSAVNVFSIPIEEGPRFEMNDKVLNLGLGSISSGEFFFEQRLKVKSQLNDKVGFRFLWFEQGNYDFESSQFFWDLNYNLSSKFNFALVGNAHYQKGENDAGAQATYRLSDVHRLTLTVYKPDFQLSEKTDTTRRFSRSPSVYTLSFKKLEARNFSDVFVRVEPRFAEYFTDSANERAGVRHSIGFTRVLSRWRTQNQFELREEVLNGVESESTLVQSRTEYDFEVFARKATAGFAYYGRTYESKGPLGDEEIHDLLPYAWIYLSDWSVGFDVANEISTDESDSFESRLSTKYAFKFSEASRLSFILTFDPDEVGHGRLWEGGGAQFNAVF